MFILYKGFDSIIWFYTMNVLSILYTISLSIGWGDSKTCILLFSWLNPCWLCIELRPFVIFIIYLATIPKLYKSLDFCNIFSSISSWSFGLNTLFFCYLLLLFANAHSSISWIDYLGRIGQLIDLALTNPWWWLISYRYLSPLATRLITVSIYSTRNGLALADL